MGSFLFVFQYANAPVFLCGGNKARRLNIYTRYTVATALLHNSSTLYKNHLVEIIYMELTWLTSLNWTNTYGAGIVLHPEKCEYVVKT